MCFRRVYRVNEKTCLLYSQVYQSTKLVVLVLLKGNLKLIPLNTRETRRIVIQEEYRVEIQEEYRVEIQGEYRVDIQGVHLVGKHVE